MGPKKIWRQEIIQAKPISKYMWLYQISPGPALDNVCSFKSGAEVKSPQL